MLSNFYNKMGTNYYGYKKPTLEILNEIAQLALKGELHSIKSKIDEYVTNVHIGKSSAGWKFLFDKNEKEWKTFAEYKSWVENYQIRTEYQEEVSQEEFWEKVESKQNCKSSVGEHCTDLDGYDFSTSNDFC